MRFQIAVCAIDWLDPEQSFRKMINFVAKLQRRLLIWSSCKVSVVETTADTFIGVLSDVDKQLSI